MEEKKYPTEMKWYDAIFKCMPGKTSDNIFGVYLSISNGCGYVVSAETLWVQRMSLPSINVTKAELGSGCVFSLSQAN